MIIASKSKYIEATIEHLEKSTASKWQKCKPRGLDSYSAKHKETLVEMMTQLDKINPKKTCGADGIHPSWIKEFDITNTDDLKHIKELLKNSLENGIVLAQG